MKNSGSSDATGNPSRSRSSSPVNSPRPSGAGTKRRRDTRVMGLDFNDEPEVDRVKRYFVGKELQKVWGRVSETGRKRIIKQYSTIGIIITEAEVEEPPPDEDESLPNSPVEPDHLLSDTEFKFSPIKCSDVNSDNQVLTSIQPDLKELLRDLDLIPNSGGAIMIELTLDVDSLYLSHAIKPDWDFYEYCYDDYRTKRFFRSDWNKRLLIKVARMNLMLKKQEELALKRKLKRSLKKAAALGGMANFGTK